MLDIVAANENQPAPPVDGGGVDHRQPRLSSARGRRAQSLSAEAAHQKGGPDDLAQDDHERDEESHQRHVRAK